MFFKKNKEEKERERKLKEEAEAKSLELQNKIAEAEKAHLEKEKTLRRDIEWPAETGAGEKLSVIESLKAGLVKTKKNFVESLYISVAGEKSIDEDILELVEEKLIEADLGLETTGRIIELLEERLERKQLSNADDVFSAVKEVIFSIMDRDSKEIPLAETGPTVLLFVGVNGVGKTTTIGKLAAQWIAEGKRVLVAAGDTFRAAAIEQLEEWCKRAGADFIAQSDHTDPAAVIFSAVEKAKAEEYDILLCDTSGRLHTKKNLMEELSKIQRVIKKIIPEAPHVSMLVLDATTGQNAVIQTREFKDLIGLDGLVITKLDGTAKGGVVIGIVNEFSLPVFYIGTGEKITDLQPFSARDFADTLFS